MEVQVNVRPFQLDDMLKINLRQIDRETGTEATAGVMGTMAASERGEALTILADDEILSIGGVVSLFPGTAELWSLASTAVDKFPISFHKANIRILDYWIKALKLRRLQCKVYSEHVRSIEWLKRLGFQEEGLMRKYDTQGRDFYLYAKVSDE